MAKKKAKKAKVSTGTLILLRGTNIKATVHVSKDTFCELVKLGAIPFTVDQIVKK